MGITKFILNNFYYGKAKWKLKVTFNFFIFVSVPLLLFTQNCSNVSFGIHTESLPSSVPTLGPAESDSLSNNIVLLHPGSQSLPIKTHFIVDNSNTMSQSQSDIANGIDSLFEKMRGFNSVVSGDNTTLNVISTVDKVYNYIPNDRGQVLNLENANLGDFLFSISGTYYNSDNPIKLEFKSDADILSQTKTLENIKNNIIKVGTNGSGDERGLFMLVRRLLAIHEPESKFSQKLFSSEDKTIITIISDEDDSSTTLKDQELDFKIKNVKSEVTSVGITDTYKEHSDLITVILEFTVDEIKDGLPYYEKYAYGFNPNIINFSRTNYINDANCNPTQITNAQNYLSQDRYSGKFVTLSSCKIVRIKSESYRNYLRPSTPTGCQRINGSGASLNFQGKQIYVYTHEDMDVTPCTVDSTPVSTSTSKDVTEISSSIVYSLFDEIYKLQPSFFIVDSVSGVKTLKPDKKVDFLVWTLKYYLEKNFGSNGYFLNAIIIPSSTTSGCVPQTNQSPGVIFEKLVATIGPSNAQVIPICKPELYSNAFKKSGDFITKKVISQFSLANYKFSSIKSIRILRADKSVIALIEDNWSLNKDNNVLSIDDSINLGLTDQVEINFNK